MALRPVDVVELERRELPYTAESTPGETLVIIRGFVLPAGLQPNAVDLLVRVPTLFPAVHPDMFWLSPAATRTNGAVIPATQVTEHIGGHDWQRWSRHLQPQQWRPDCDDLGTYIDIVAQCLRASAQ
jgi:hypothetical protein